MQPTVLAATAAPRTVDDYLGSGERRFFGAGYKRARQRLKDLAVRVDADGSGTVTGRASVRYPQDWSRKGDTDQAPHLSSIDVLLLGGEVAEVFLTCALGLTVGDRAGLRLRRVRMKAGGSPVEEQLGDFPLSARIGVPVPAADRPDTAVSTVDCQIGTLRIRAEILHPAREPRPGMAGYADADEALGPAQLRPYGTAHAWKSQLIDRLELDLPGRRAQAVLDVRCAAPDRLVVAGLESHTFRTTSILDVFVAAIQLGQILLYELDGVSRARSNTLWMRQTVLDIAAPYPPVAGPAPLDVHLDDWQLLTDADGAAWRCATVAGRLAHLRVDCDVAHRLP